MAKQTFTTGQVLTADQMTSLQQTAMGGGVASAKTASYVLVAADAGTAITMTSASATTITVNTGLFAAGDAVQIINLGAGTCTITAGTATVSTAGSLALSQYESGWLYFTATGTAIFNDYVQAGGGGKVLQVVQGTTSTTATITSTTMTDTNLTATITPSAATSKILALVSIQAEMYNYDNDMQIGTRLVRGSTEIMDASGGSGNASGFIFVSSSTLTQLGHYIAYHYLDSPSTTSATTYKVQGKVGPNGAGTGTVTFNNSLSTIILMEIGA